MQWFICHTYVLVCHSYATRMWFYPERFSTVLFRTFRQSWFDTEKLHSFMTSTKRKRVNSEFLGNSADGCRPFLRRGYFYSWDFHIYKEANLFVPSWLLTIRLLPSCNFLCWFYRQFYHGDTGGKIATHENCLVYCLFPLLSILLYLWKL